MTIPDDVVAFLDELGLTRRHRAISETFLELVPWDEVSYSVERSNLKGVRLLDRGRAFCWIFPKGGRFQFTHPRSEDLAARFPEVESRSKGLNLPFRDVHSARIAAEVADQTLEAIGSRVRFLS